MKLVATILDSEVPEDVKSAFISCSALNCLIGHLLFLLLILFSLYYIRQTESQIGLLGFNWVITRSWDLIWMKPSVRRESSLVNSCLRNSAKGLKEWRGKTSRLSEGTWVVFSRYGNFQMFEDRRNSSLKKYTKIMGKKGSS